MRRGLRRAAMVEHLRHLACAKIARAQPEAAIFLASPLFSRSYPGKKLFPPPPSAQFWPEGIFRERGARGCVFFLKAPANQQFTYGVVSKGVFAESLRKFCGKFAEICKEMSVIAPGKGAEILRKFRGNVRNIFCNDPFPNDPIS